MKKSSWMILFVSAVLSAGLRVWQMLAGFEESGLAKRGFVPGLALPVVLLAAAVYFTLSARSLPGRRADALRLAKEFRFADNMPAVFGAVAGSFLVMLGGGLYFVKSGRSALTMLLAVFAVAAAASVLYTAFALYRGSEVQNLALLAPICALVLMLVYIYRADATDPVLTRTYVEILAVSALTLSVSLRAAFVFGGSAPRRFLPIAALAVILSVTAAAECAEASHIALFAGCAAIELGFLAAADFS